MCDVYLLISPLFLNIKIKHTSILLKDKRTGDVMEYSFNLSGLQIFFFEKQNIQKIYLGYTNNTIIECKNIIYNLDMIKKSYNIITNNCNMFCSEVAKKLNVSKIPEDLEHQVDYVSKKFLSHTINFVRIISDKVSDTQRLMRNK